jgi:hypothetical protein
MITVLYVSTDLLTGWGVLLLRLPERIARARFDSWVVSRSDEGTLSAYKSTP